MHDPYFLAGFMAGVFFGGFLSYKFADELISKTVAEFKKLEAAAAAGLNQADAVAHKFVADVKKDL